MPKDKDDKNYADLKTPADFPEDTSSDDTPPDDTPSDTPSDDVPSDTPAEKPDVGEQLSQIGETLSKLNERMDSLEDNVITPPSKPAEGGFAPDLEKGQYLPADYRPKTYNEFLQKTLEISRQVDQYEDQKMTTQEKQWNDEWTTQLDQLTKEGKLPPVKDPVDKNDPGKKARAQLLIDAATAGSVNLLNFYRATEKYRKSGGSTPPSSRAPVGPGRTGGAPAPTAKSYDELKRPVDQVLEEKYPDLVPK